MNQIDLRSDTVTRPTPAMRSAMAQAEVGDDVYGEDPSVNRLEQTAADLLGLEAGVFVSSGTQGNLLALLSHCERGDEYIAGQYAHTYRTEGGGAAVLGGIQPQPLDFEPDGTLDLDAVAGAIKPVDPHYARTRVLCLENTQGGKVLPLDYLDRAHAFTREHGLAMHLDGARVFNAAVALGVPVNRIATLFDSVSFCLSKGLGAPVGSVLCGTRELIDRARRWRKVVGGGMRQAGILAAAGLVALEHHVDRLADDHANAKHLASGLAEIGPLEVDPEPVQTNMVFVSGDDRTMDKWTDHMVAQGVLIRRGNRKRLVTHLDVSTQDVEQVVRASAQCFS